MKNILTALSVLLATFFSLSCLTASAARPDGMLAGKVMDADGAPLDFVTVYLKDTPYSTSTDERGVFHLSAPEGSYTAVFAQVGFEQREERVKIPRSGRSTIKVKMKPTTVLDELTVTANPLDKVRGSAYNATAVNTREMAAMSRTLGDALAKAPGMKLRESGGAGSDMTLSMDGFSGRHVKVFIDGVAQEGAGSGMGINNIPVGQAERIEVYRGVVPVAFGTDALGGVINVVTRKRPTSLFADASYSFGSFNTHRSAVNFGQKFAKGFKYEISAFQNYSDNDYWVESPVEDFTTGALNRKKLERVKRFNDTYRNEAATVRAGWERTAWADRLMAGMTASHLYKEIQTGVRQTVVYGQKHRHGYTVSPSLEYSKRGLLLRNLDLSANAAYNINRTVNVDTATHKYNWRGETQPLNSPGEQAYQLLRSESDNLTASASASYAIDRRNHLTLNNSYNLFVRNTVDLLTSPHTRSAIAKRTAKNIAGLAYRFTPTEAVNVSLFGKHYAQSVAGPAATSTSLDTYVRSERRVSATGYGAAATWLAPKGLQLKASYEKAFRLPTIEEMFGDEDLEVGSMTLRPESSHNVNLNLSYTLTRGTHSLFAETSLILRDTRDYIQRNILALSGGKSAATYVNYGRVATTGYTLTARYNYGRHLTLGANLTQMNVRDNMRVSPSTGTENLSYGERMPNLPYLFADMDVTLRRKGVSLTYDNRFTQSFCYYASNLGTNRSDYMVPSQWEHNIALSYSLARGRYTFTLECRNLTDARLYDNFSLQKPGRAFYGKVQVAIGR